MFVTDLEEIGVNNRLVSDVKFTRVFYFERAPGIQRILYFGLIIIRFHSQLFKQALEHQLVRISISLNSLAQKKIMVLWWFVGLKYGCHLIFIIKKISLKCLTFTHLVTINNNQFTMEDSMVDKIMPSSSVLKQNKLLQCSTSFKVEADRSNPLVRKISVTSGKIHSVQTFIHWRSLLSSG